MNAPRTVTDPNPHALFGQGFLEVQSGTIVLNSKYGPMLPAFSAQQIGSALGWGGDGGNRG